MVLWFRRHKIQTRKARLMAGNDSFRVYWTEKGKEIEDTIPNHPGSDQWTRFVLLSDTHSKTSYNVPSGDVLIHAGDLSSWGRPDKLQVIKSILKYHLY